MCRSVVETVPTRTGLTFAAEVDILMLLWKAVTDPSNFIETCPDSEDQLFRNFPVFNRTRKFFI